MSEVDILAELNIEIEKIEKITKGWSADEKYKITTKQGKTLLLRLASVDKYDEKEKEFQIITKYSKTGICMSMPMEFGVCNQNNNVYMILSWIEGQDLENVLPQLSEKEQYSMRTDRVCEIVLKAFL